MTDFVIRMEGVSKAFRGIDVLTDVDLVVHEGECLAVTGPNGSGKSVLFRLMCRLLRPDRGHVEIAPRFMPRGATFPRDFGIVIDRPGYVPGRTGIQNLLDLAALRGKIGRAEVEATMRRVGLDPGTPQPVRAYSLGMKQKLGLAQAIMEGQQVHLLDEPFNALDTESVANTRALIRELLDAGHTVVFTSHQPDEVDALANRVVRIDGGRLVGDTSRRTA